MSVSRQFRDDLLRQFDFITGENKRELTNRNSRSRSRSPVPRTSGKSQIEKIKTSLDLEALQKKTEEYRKKSLEKRKIMSKETFEAEAKRASPEFKGEKSREIIVTSPVYNTKRIRNEFPKQLISEFPFLQSPEHQENEVESIFKLFDESCNKSDLESAIVGITSSSSS